MGIHCQAKGANYNIVHSQQMRFALPPAILISEIFCFTSLKFSFFFFKSGSRHASPAINIYDRIKKQKEPQQNLFLVMLCIPLYRYRAK